MYIAIDPKSSVPLYAQVKEQMRLAVATGVLQAGDQLPTVRDLATQLRVNFNTVARAYRELRDEGMLNSKQGSGTFVTAEAKRIGRREARQVVERLLHQAAAAAQNLGLDGADTLTMLAEALIMGPKESGEPEEVNPYGAISD